MTYDYFSINFASVTGFIFLLIFLYANATLHPKVKRIFYLMILLEFIEMLAYSLELWTTTFETLSPLRLWLSAVGYAVRPFIFFLMLMLALRNTDEKPFPKVYYLPALVNSVAAFSVFFTDIVYSYTLDNQFHRGPLGFITYIVVILYLIILIVVVTRSHAHRPRLEVLIIFAISVLLLFGMVIEATLAVRTINRTSIIMATIFYYMFFQTQIHNASMTKEQSIRRELEHANRIDGSTGVLNKKAFTDAAKRALFDPTAPAPESVGFVFLDLDHLKELNDTLGHAAGDTAIADMADTVRSLCRQTDLIGRFGGDEFYILLPDITKQRFYALLNDAQVLLQREYASGSTVVPVTASIGAVYTEQIRNMTYDQLVRQADEALYDAKASGRNCHVVRVL